MKIGPKYKVCRRLGSRVFGKCQTTKFSISGSAKKGGRTGSRRPRAASEYGQQLLEKQKARYTYGLKEYQLANYVKAARRHAKTDPQSVLFQKLENRLDNVVYRLGLSPSRLGARQLVTHGHIMVNGHRLNIPSYQVRIGDKISIRPQSRNLGNFQSLAEKLKEYQTPVWLALDDDKVTGEVKAVPVTGSGELDLNFSSILEFYSRV